MPTDGEVLRNVSDQELRRRVGEVISFIQERSGDLLATCDFLDVASTTPIDDLSTNMELEAAKRGITAETSALVAIRKLLIQGHTP